MSKEPIIDLRVIQYGEEDENGEVTLTGYKLMFQRAGSAEWEKVKADLEIKRVGNSKQAKP